MPKTSFFQHRSVQITRRLDMLRRRLFVISLVLAFTLLAALPVLAGFSGTSPDSGTCGNYWATDYLVRWGTNFAPTSFIMNFKGNFVTVAGFSPGACEAGPNNGNTVQAGLQGSFSGFFTVNVVGGTFNPSAVCSQATCNTTLGTVHTLYGAGATYNTSGPFHFDYNTCDGKQHWQNASTGNSGDITGGPVACSKPASVVETPPQSCNANSVVLAPYVGRRVHVFLVRPSGRQELQYEATNLVEAGLKDGHPSGKVSFVFYPQGGSWREFEGDTLLVTIESYKDGWYWYPKAGANGQLFCDWKPAPGANAKQ